MSAAPLPHWYLIGAGHIGTLAAGYLLVAGHRVTVLRPGSDTYLDTTIRYADSRPNRPLRLAVVAPDRLSGPVAHLVVACKTLYTETALARVPIADDALVIRLQNGIGSLDGLLPANARRIEAVTASAVKGARDCHYVVAENTTWMGGIERKPAWFDGLAAHWPKLRWTSDIRPRQWRKLVANAAINPLTALHCVPNGALVDDPDLHGHMATLVAEADALLHQLDPAWPGESLADVEAVARATAGNKSSMRADVERGARTEIDIINGWLLRQGQRIGMALPAHRAIADAIAKYTI